MSASQQQGNFIDQIGTFLHLPEWGISESIAGGPTTNTATNTQAYGPVYNGPVQGPAQVLGTTYKAPTTALPNISQTPTVQTPQQPSQPSQEDLYANQQRNDINSGYQSYFDSLDQMMNSGLSGQKASQQGIIQGQFDQGTNNLALQQTQGVSALGAEEVAATNNQNKNLKNLAENMRNQYMAGNNYLGARGAGDSSAVNQYAYALNKLGNQSRGDVMNNTSNILGEVGRRRTSLIETVAAETRNLQTNRDSQINQLENWYYQQQNAIVQAKANGQLSQSRDLASLSQSLLSQAQTRLNNITADAESRYTQLQSWAVNNATTLQDLYKNLSSVSAYNPALPQYQPLNGQPTSDAQGNMNYQPSLVGGSTRKYDNFGNPI